MKKNEFTFAERILAHNPRRKSAFTLAEVLITLVIIGVIGALTLPSLIQNTQKQEYVSALKKAYSTFSQVTQQIIMEEGNPKGDDGGWASDADNVYNLYKKQLNVLKDCGSGEGCFSYLGTASGNGHKRLKANGNIMLHTDNFNTNTAFRKLILSDGMNIGFQFIGTSCPDDLCARIWVDINGEKGPNTWGRDVFMFKIRPNGLYPAGCDISRDSGIFDSEKCDDIYCTCRVLREGAMNY